VSREQVGGPGRRRRLGIVLAACVVFMGLSGAAGAVSSSNGGEPRRWTYQRPPYPSSRTEAGLNAVSCSSPTACTAIGGWRRGPLAEHWDGAHWSYQRLPSPKQASYNAISCPSRSSCFAVGCAFSFVRGCPQSALVTDRILIAHWNGSRWSRQKTAIQSGAFYGVACASQHFCIAVGGATIERWNGQTWSPMNHPAASLAGVACWSARGCVAVGSTAGGGPGPNCAYYLRFPVVERWDGRRWSAQPVPVPCQNGDVMDAGLTAVSCRSAKMCLAVGSNTPGSGVGHSLGEWWNGKTWVETEPPNGPEPGEPSSVVACNRVCLTIGSGVGQWNGRRWTRPPHSLVALAKKVTILGMSCPSANVCVAGGYYHEAIVARGP
jgi:hypothetical protein